MPHIGANTTVDGAMTVKILVPIQLCVGIVTLFRNVLALIVTLRDKTLTKTTNILIGSLACVNAFVGMVSMPVVIMSMYYTL